MRTAPARDADHDADDVDARRRPRAPPVSRSATPWSMPIWVSSGPACRVSVSSDDEHEGTRAGRGGAGPGTRRRLQRPVARAAMAEVDLGLGVLGLGVEDGLDLVRPARPGRRRTAARRAALCADGRRPPRPWVRPPAAAPAHQAGLVRRAWAQRSRRSGGSVAQELGVGPVGDDPAALEQHDPVGQGDGRQPVGDDRSSSGRPERSASASWMSSSTWTSIALVASSRMRIRGLTSRVRAMAMRWRCPPESV